MSPVITEVVVESKKTLKLPNGDYVSESRSLRIGFEKNELPLRELPEDLDLQLYLRGLGRMTEGQVAEALEPYLGDGEFKSAEERADRERPSKREEKKFELLTEKQQNAIYAKGRALDKLGEEKLAEAIVSSHVKDAEIETVANLSKWQASDLLDTLDREIKDRQGKE